MLQINSQMNSVTQYVLISADSSNKAHSKSNASCYVGCWWNATKQAAAEYQSDKMMSDMTIHMKQKCVTECRTRLNILAFSNAC